MTKVVHDFYLNIAQGPRGHFTYYSISVTLYLGVLKWVILVSTFTNELVAH